MQLQSATSTRVNQTPVFKQVAALPLSTLNQAVSGEDATAYPAETVARWQLFNPTVPVTERLSAARLTAAWEIADSMHESDSIEGTIALIRDRYHDLLPGVNISVEQVWDVLTPASTQPSRASFPYLSQTGTQRLLRDIKREPRTVMDVNQRMMGLPLLDKSKNLLGVVFLSLHQDYSSFPEWTRPIIEHFRRSASVALESEVNRARSMVDGLTGLWNKTFFKIHIEKEFGKSQRRGEPLSVLMLDLDKFKPINDTYGHPFGDVVLAHVAAAIKDSIRTDTDDDVAVRYGGEEFAVVLSNTDAEQASVIAERIRSNVSKLQILNDDNEVVPITVSVGSSTFNPGEESNSAQLIKAADQHLYRAKRGGRNRVVSSSGIPVVSNEGTEGWEKDSAETFTI